MSRFFSILAAVAFPTAAFAETITDATDCMMDRMFSRGQFQSSCVGSDISRTFMFQNQCSKAIESKVCFQRSNGKPPDCNIVRTPAGKANMVFGGCGTGKVHWQARFEGSDMRFVPDNELPWHQR